MSFMIFKNVSDLEWNIITHDKISKKYEKIHGEIYNDHEQNRLKEQLNIAIASIKTQDETKTVLDFGCGAGNLTQHLSEAGCNVVAGDVSQGFLDLIGSRSYLTNVKTLLLNGADLSNISSASVDMVATYSVLHHVPDYLGILKEFVRVLKPGGVLYIDHEPSMAFWKNEEIYGDFKTRMKPHLKFRYQKFFVLSNYYDWLIRKLVNPRYHREGDIHVFEDDHVEWDKVLSVLVSEGCKVLLDKDYLLFRLNYNQQVFDEFAHITSDMHVLVVEKVRP